MERKLLLALGALLIFSTGTVFAQGSLISVQTDDSHYDEGDTIVISGQVTTIIGDTPVILQLFIEGAFKEAAQITVAQDGSYSYTIIAEGPQWNKGGDYLVRVTYGGGNAAEAEFSYTPNSGAITTTKSFEVDAGSHGTFDVEYTIKGGTVRDMVVDSDNFALVVQVDSTDEGFITVDLPREFIGAEKQDGKDEIFIILIDGIGVAYEEAAVHANSRIITINFEQGDSDITIIGTYVLPEFGTVVLLVMAAGITATIALTRGRFQIRT